MSFFSFCEFYAVSYPKCLRCLFCPMPNLHSLYPLGLVAVRAQSTGMSSSPSKQCHIWVNDADETEFENSDTHLSPKPLKPKFAWKTEEDFPFLPHSILCPAHAEGDESSPQAAFLCLLNGPMP